MFFVLRTLYFTATIVLKEKKTLPRSLLDYVVIVGGDKYLNSQNCAVQIFLFETPQIQSFQQKYTEEDHPHRRSWAISVMEKLVSECKFDQSIIQIHVVSFDLKIKLKHLTSSEEVFKNRTGVRFYKKTVKRHHSIVHLVNVTHPT